MWLIRHWSSRRGISTGLGVQYDLALRAFHPPKATNIQVPNASESQSSFITDLDAWHIPFLVVREVSLKDPNQRDLERGKQRGNQNSRFTTGANAHYSTPEGPSRGLLSRIWLGNYGDASRRTSELSQNSAYMGVRRLPPVSQKKNQIVTAPLPPPCAHLICAFPLLLSQDTRPLEFLLILWWCRMDRYPWASILGHPKIVSSLQMWGRCPYAFRI
ncbi:hypothetical protein PM082_008389 [Marasmius tenuissimus]|nr:hypothetical protein PM082_008389 [Marasmius tenuissimus]